MRTIVSNGNRKENLVMNARSKKKGLVYVVDNSHLYQEIVKMVLEREGYSVRLFDDGYNVLKALNVHKAVNIRVPDLIICEVNTVSYTHLRAHETKANLVCRLLLEKKKNTTTKHNSDMSTPTQPESQNYM